MLNLYFELAAGYDLPDSKVHGANMGPTWVLSAPDGPHVGLMNLAIRVIMQAYGSQNYRRCTKLHNVKGKMEVLAVPRGAFIVMVIPRKLILNLNLTNSRFSITYCPLTRSFWNAAQITKAISQRSDNWSVHNGQASLGIKLNFEREWHHIMQQHPHFRTPRVSIKEIMSTAVLSLPYKIWHDWGA